VLLENISQAVAPDAVVKCSCGKVAIRLINSQGQPAGGCAHLQCGCCAGLLTQGVLGVPRDPSAPRRGPLGPFPDRERAIHVGNAPALVPEPLARR
jgi:hypothetical protein